MKLSCLALSLLCSTALLGYAETAGEDEGVIICGVELAQRADFSTGNACRLYEHIAFLWHLFVGEMVNHVILVDVRGKNIITGAMLGNSEQGKSGFMDLGAIEHATTR